MIKTAGTVTITETSVTAEHFVFEGVDFYGAQQDVTDWILSRVRTTVQLPTEGH